MNHKERMLANTSRLFNNIPANVIATENPCRVLREITEADRDYCYKE